MRLLQRAATHALGIGGFDIATLSVLNANTMRKVMIVVLVVDDELPGVQAPKNEKDYLDLVNRLHATT